MTLAEMDAAASFAAGVLGLVLPQLVLFMLVSRPGAHVVLAKAPTAVVVFLLDFRCRRDLVFAAAPRS